MTKPTLLLGLLFCSASFARLHAAEVRSALLVGVWQYSDPTFSPLPGIADDVRKMDVKLRQLGFDVTIVTNPKLGEAKEAIDAFGATLRARKGVALFYFSGHGCENDGKNFLIPCGTKIRARADLSDEALSAQRVLNRMEEAGTEVNLVFLDVCRSNLTKSGETGLAPMHGNGTFIGFATASEQVANAAQGGSVYTAALLAHLATPALSIFDMHTRVTKDVRIVTAKADRPQVPFQYSGLDQVFYFVPPTPVGRTMAPQQLNGTVVATARPASAEARAEATHADGLGRITVTLSKAQYRLGEGLGIEVGVDRNCFVRIAQFGSDNSTTQLFPNAFDPDNFVRAHRVLRVPNTTYRLRTNPPAGEEKIVVFVSEGQFADHDGLLSSTTSGQAFPVLRRNAVINARGTISVEAVDKDQKQAPVVGVSVPYRLVE